MRRSAVLLIGAVLLLGRANGADDVVTVRMAHTRLLQFEPVVVFVAVRNVSEDMIIFGGDKKDGDATLDLLVKKGPTDWIQRREGARLAGKVRVLPDDRKETLIELSRWYDLTVMGNYMLTAVVEYDGQRFTSPPVRFDVDNGLPMDRLTQSFAGDRMPARTFSLRYLSREDYERLFLRVDEEETGINYGSFELGPLVRVRKPEMRIEKGGQVMIRHQSASDCFTRSVFKSDPEGVSFVDQKYFHENGSPFRFEEKAKEEPSKGKSSN